MAFVSILCTELQFLPHREQNPCPL